MSLFLNKIFGPNLTDLTNTTPTLSLKDFYTGNLKAHGVATNLFGKVVRRFKADVKGAQEGEKLKVNEFFTYDDGRTFDRNWDMRQTNPEGTKFTGTGADILGNIIAETHGYGALLKYTLKIPKKGSKNNFKTMHITHWQYQIDETHTLHFLK